MKLFSAHLYFLVYKYSNISNLRIGFVKTVKDFVTTLFEKSTFDRLYRYRERFEDTLVRICRKSILKKNNIKTVFVLRITFRPCYYQIPVLLFIQLSCLNSL